MSSVWYQRQTSDALEADLAEWRAWWLENRFTCHPRAAETALDAIYALECELRRRATTDNYL